MQRYRHQTACGYGEVAAEPLCGLYICDLPKLAARGHMRGQGRAGYQTHSMLRRVDTQRAIAMGHQEKVARMKGDA